MRLTKAESCISWSWRGSRGQVPQGWTRLEALPRGQAVESVMGQARLPAAWVGVSTCVGSLGSLGHVAPVGPECVLGEGLHHGLLAVPSRSGWGVGTPVEPADLVRAQSFCHTRKHTLRLAGGLRIK